MEKLSACFRKGVQADACLSWSPHLNWNTFPQNQLLFLDIIQKIEEP